MKLIAVNATTNNHLDTCNYPRQCGERQLVATGDLLSSVLV